MLIASGKKPGPSFNTPPYTTTFSLRINQIHLHTYISTVYTYIHTNIRLSAECLVLHSPVNVNALVTNSSMNNGRWDGHSIWLRKQPYKPWRYSRHLNVCVCTNVCKSLVHILRLICVFNTSPWSKCYMNLHTYVHVPCMRALGHVTFEFVHFHHSHFQ